MGHYFTIKLENVELFGRHGLFSEEQKIGMIFSLNANIVYFVKEPDLKINNIIDYTTLLELVKKRWQINELLLENLLLKLSQDLKEQYKHITEISLEVAKKFNTIGKLNGNIMVAFHQKYE